MSETEPSFPIGARRQPTPTPPPSYPPPSLPATEPTATAEPDDADELIERLQEQIALLESQLSSALDAASTPVLRVGEGVRRVSLNARSIAAIYAVPEMQPNQTTDVLTGRWRVQADTHVLTDWLPELEARRKLDHYDQQWVQILQPPKRSS